MILARDKAVLHFSGGKDSLACLHLMKPHWDHITVMWCNSGAAYPETLRQMEQVRAMVPHFVEVRSDQPAQVAMHGFPADVVPVRSTSLGKYITQATERPSIQSYIECCHANIWKPLWDETKASGAKVVIRGQRNSDDRKAPTRSGETHDGVRMLYPIEDWSEERVRKYLDDEGVKLPPHYAYVNSSLDCWSCTAYMNDNVGRIQHMKESQPVMWSQYKPRLDAIRSAVRDEMKHLEAL